ncbi:MAG: YicC family protein [Ruminococcus sp.]|nr:YicC family protein [Ruminococcus sp.]
MVRSMTGYGRYQQIVGNRDILVEIRSVNYRYFEFSCRIPRNMGYLEEKLKRLIKENVSRGKIEVLVTINNVDGKDETISVNMGVAQGYIDALRSANDTFKLPDDLTLSQLSRFPDVFTVIKTIDDENEIWDAVKLIAEKSLEKFVAMKSIEGEKMFKDVLSKLDTIESMVGVVEVASPQTIENYRKRLYDKLSEVLESKDIDESRIVTECALLSEKLAVDEETVRLRSHISQFRELLNSNEPVGRKLDFLIQEMNREVNTTGSKAQDITITKTVVDMKSELEKIREQIQNIE